jgi:glycosyltransferase involved in cell wall biosynthesis
VITQKPKPIMENNLFGKKIVSFIGRVTYQKGTDYFVEAADKILQHDKDFIFVLAGDGDMLDKMIDLVAKKKISKNFFFTGFLQAEELRELLSISSVFVMPSVSEPFGIAPLEAMQAGVPTIISKQSGVAEVLNHAVKVDFWDIDSLSDAIYSIGKNRALSDMLSKNGKAEATAITWDKAADKLKELYTEMSEKYHKL